MIWGGISWQGATPLVLFETGTKINNGMYQAVLESAYKNWAKSDFQLNQLTSFDQFRDKFGGRAILIQDNAPCHTAGGTKEYLNRENIQVCTNYQPFHKIIYRAKYTTQGIGLAAGIPGYQRR